jgi:hypothetical protein
MAEGAEVIEVKRLAAVSERLYMVNVYRRLSAPALTT